MPGTTDQMLMKKIQKNIVAKNGVQFFPSSPIAASEMFSSMASYPASATFWMPTGTSALRRPPSQKKPMQITVETHAMSAVLLNSRTECSLKMPFHWKSSLMFGSSSPRTRFTHQLLSAHGAWA